MGAESRLGFGEAARSKKVVAPFKASATDTAKINLPLEAALIAMDAYSEIALSTTMRFLTEGRRGVTPTEEERLIEAMSKIEAYRSVPRREQGLRREKIDAAAKAAENMLRTVERLSLALGSPMPESVGGLLTGIDSARRTANLQSMAGASKIFDESAVETTLVTCGHPGIAVETARAHIEACTAGMGDAQREYAGKLLKRTDGASCSESVRLLVPLLRMLSEYSDPAVGENSAFLSKWLRKGAPQQESDHGYARERGDGGWGQRGEDPSNHEGASKAKPKPEAECTKVDAYGRKRVGKRKDKDRDGGDER